jgi:hypothetical protein
MKEELWECVQQINSESNNESIHTFPSQAVSTNPGVWQEGPSTKSIVVDENTMYSTQGARLLSDTTYDITKTCLNPNQILH